MSKTRRLTIGKKIRTRREALNLSRAALVRLLRAEGLPITERTLQRWENDDNAPDVKHTSTLHRVLAVDLV